MQIIKVLGSAVRVVFSAHVSAEDRVPPGAIFREKIEGRWYRMCLRPGPGNPNLVPVLVARRIRSAKWLAFATEGRTDIVETMSSTPTE